MGNPFGAPGDARMQERILREALRLFDAVTEGGTIVDAPHRWDDDFTAIVDRTLGAMAPGGS